MEEIAVDRLAVIVDAFVVDVREPDEYAGGHMPGARNIPLSDVRARVSELPDAGVVYVICQSGRRSAVACEALGSSGVRPVNVSGGTSAWIGAGLPVQR